MCVCVWERERERVCVCVRERERESACVCVWDHRDRGASYRLVKDSLKKSLGACHIDHRRWFTEAGNRKTWRFTTNHVVFTFVKTRRATLKVKRGRNSNTIRSNLDKTFSCGCCNSASQSCIGLISHDSTRSWCETATSRASFTTWSHYGRYGEK